MGEAGAIRQELLQMTARIDAIAKVLKTDTQTVECDMAGSDTDEIQTKIAETRAAIQVQDQRTMEKAEAAEREAEEKRRRQDEDRQSAHALRYSLTVSVERIQDALSDTGRSVYLTHPDTPEGVVDRSEIRVTHDSIDTGYSVQVDLNPDRSLRIERLGNTVGAVRQASLSDPHATVETAVYDTVIAVATKT